MIPAAEANAVPSTETFGLPAEVPHLISKLRLGLIPPEVLATITHKEPEATP